jgi:hypothetical protein
MAVTRFEGRGPVARYWLANCEGFAVKGGAHGVVEELIHDADSLVPTRLVVRTRSRRRTIVPADAIESVVPANRVLVVERRAERRNVPQPRPVTAARVAGARASRVVVPTAQAAGKKVAAAGPPARSAVLAAGRSVASTMPPARSALRQGGRELSRRGRPALLMLASSFEVLAAEVHATVRMLVRSTTHYAEALAAWRRPAARPDPGRVRREAGVRGKSASAVRRR